MQVGCTEILDFRELMESLFGIVALRVMITQRVAWLKRQYYFYCILPRLRDI